MERSTERIAALEVALNNEARERDFYLQQEERTTNGHGKRMFATLARDESEHYQRLLELHGKLREGGKWPESVSRRVKGTEVKDLIRRLVDAVDIPSKTDLDDLEAVRVAIDFETKGEMFYSDLSRIASDPEGKQFYSFLASMEREHRLSLEDTLEYFQDPEGWHRLKERLHIDGAS
ncbi:MAG: ferritin family protein [Deltaproteobacteria bacterium]|nr:ferritin family protein [Deltaproteobacteria bacterium]